MRHPSDPGPSSAAAWALLILVTPACPPAQVTALEGVDGGIDYRIQGEYFGKVETVDPVGVQVKALGGGRFRASWLAGGLPGAGWDGSAPGPAEGVLDTAVGADFTGASFTARIDTGGLTCSGRTRDGRLFSFNKHERRSPDEGAPPPPGALALFSGDGTGAFRPGTADMDVRNLLEPLGAGAITTRAFSDFTLHLEFRVPFMPQRGDAQRGQGGVFLQNRHELEILDSFGNPGDTGMPARHACGAFPHLAAPAVPMAFPPLAWQTYRIEFTAARYQDAHLLEPARATVWWNGVRVHAGLPLVLPSAGGDSLGPQPGPLRFPATGDPVYYRNIWILEGKPGAVIRPGKGPVGGKAFPKDSKGSKIRADGRVVRVGEFPGEPSIRPARGYFLSVPAAGAP